MSRSIPCRDDAIKIKRCQQGHSLARIQLALDIDVATVQRLKIEAIGQIDDGLSRQRHRTFDLRRIEIKRCADIATAGPILRFTHFGIELHAGCAGLLCNRRHPFGQRRRKRRDEAAHLRERRRSSHQREFASTVGAIERSTSVDRHIAVRVTGRDPLQPDCLRPVAQADRRRPHRLPSKCSAVGLQRNFGLVRPCRLRTGERCHKRGYAIDIERGGFQRGLEPRLAISRRHQRETACRRAAVNIACEMIERDAICGNRRLSAQAERLLTAPGDIAAPLQPRGESLGIR